MEEVHAAFGASASDFEMSVLNGIIPFSPTIDAIFERGQFLIQQVRNNEATPLVTALLHGASGSGKTAIAAKLALSSDFSFVRLVSAESMVGFSESAKVNAITKVIHFLCILSFLDFQ